MNENTFKAIIPLYQFARRSLPPKITIILLLLQEAIFRPVPEAIETKMVRSFCHADDTILEVGARTGVTTQLLSSLVKEKGMVIAAEPNPFAFKLLRHRLRALKNVLSVNVAIGDKNGRSTLWMESAGDVGASMSFHSRGHRVEVDMMKSDDLVAKLGVGLVDIVIVDSEGYEEKVLLGAQSILSHARALIVEVHHFLDDNSGQKVDRIASSFGYTKKETRIESTNPYITENLYLRDGKKEPDERE
ncbi:MAG TPA: FkbM family methyltransferase [Nitrososphaerales archaeon]|nr:FkbM family methyltransferase [Nitrososphaerales archaeon]